MLLALTEVCCRHCAVTQRVRDTWRDFASASLDGCLIDWQLHAWNRLEAWRVRKLTLLAREPRAYVKGNDENFRILLMMFVILPQI